VFGVLYSSTEIIGVIIWRRMRCTGHVVCSWIIRDTNGISVTKNWRNQIPWETRSRWEDNFQLSIVTRLCDCWSRIPGKRIVLCVLRVVYTGWGSQCLLYTGQRIVFTPGVKWQWREAGDYIHLEPRIRIGGAVPSLPHTSSCRVP
jgi:hypothetical protein